MSGAQEAATPRRHDHIRVLRAAPSAHEGAAESSERSEDEIIARLGAALPRARRVLQIGSDARLERAYRRRYPDAQWQSHPDAEPSLEGEPRAQFDLIVVDKALQCLVDPLRLLRALARLATPEATLFVHAVNAAHIGMLPRLFEADLSAEPDAPTDPNYRRSDSPSSAFKLLMDGGWMPSLKDQIADAPQQPEVVASAMMIADALGVPRRTAARTLMMRRLLIEARRSFDDAVFEPGHACFTVVVPTTREQQLRLNVLQSPGLREVDARIVSVREAANPAQALERALPQCEQDWVLLCHQDVYFADGFGHRLNALLSAIPAEERDRTLLGFVGVGVNAAADGVEPAGFVIDRMARADHPASDKVMSIDELAIVVSRQSVHRIDPSIGWHLWATELCLTSIAEHKVFPRIVRLPLFHNSLNDFSLPAAFHESAARLWAKHAAFGSIPTLCGTIDRAFVVRHGSARR